MSLFKSKMFVTSATSRPANRISKVIRQLLSHFGKKTLCRAGLFGVVAGIGIISLGFHAQADTIVRGFKAQGALQPGWVVSLTESSPAAVEAAPAADSTRIYGVVIDPSNAPATIQGQDEEVFVATSGNYPVLVSTENGSIKVGDYLSMSSTDGIAAKATSDQSFALGRAIDDFDGKGQLVISEANGYPIGRITGQLSPARNPSYKGDIAIPGPLRQVAQDIAGKPVAALRIYAALAIFAASAIIAVSLLTIGIRSGMVAIGRNPLSRPSIVRSLGQTLIISVLIFVAGLFGIYLLLRV